MEHTKLVTPSELEDFADRRDSEAVIPEVVALLVELSVPDLTLCRIPYGDSIGLADFDYLLLMCAHLILTGQEGVDGTLERIVKECIEERRRH
jgi:hypothetical protein